MTEEQTQLMNLMRDHSERCYCAGWMNDLEFALWAIATGGGGSYGMVEISPEQAHELLTLAFKADSWIVWRDSEDIATQCETAVPLVEWLASLVPRQGKLDAFREARW